MSSEVQRDVPSPATGLEVETRPPVVLASMSPRRRELIGALDVPVVFADADVDEGPPRAGEPPDEYVSRLSLKKARAAAGAHSRAIVIGADTAVAIGPTILGKPSGREDAIRMLRMIRGRVHTVFTGVTLIDRPSGLRRQSARGTGVRIRAYSDAELEGYLAEGTYRDKAGAYAVQDSRFSPAEEVLGCYLNAMGFPLCDVAALLADFGVRARLRPGWRLPQQCADCHLREPRGEEAGQC